MTYLSADEILSADDLAQEPVEVPEWGGTVLVRGMSGTERDKFEASMLDKSMNALPKDKALENYRARLACACLVDAEGNQLFRGEALVKRLGTKSAEALQRVCDVASRLSGLTKEDEESLTGN